MNVAEHFVRPDLAWLFVLVPVAGFLLLLLDRRRARRLSQSVGLRAHLLTGELSRRRRRIGLILFLSAVGFLVIAAMQPRWGKGAGSLTPRGVNIVVCLDVSRSMLARDLSPSRLGRARREIRALAGRADGDRLGLVVFAGEARLLVPLTKDLRSFAQLMDQADPLIVARGGTDLGAALLTALKALDRRAGTILLLTDGDDLEGRGLSVAKTCKERGITVHTVGLGSVRGAKIPVTEGGREIFLQNNAGDEVVSAMDERGLSRIADLTNGEFLIATDAARPLVTWYEDHIRPMAHQTFLAEERRERENRYQWPLLLAFLLLLTDLGLCEKR